MKSFLPKIKMLEKVSYGPVLNEVLTELHCDVPASLHNGRNVVAGTARGWGLQFGGLERALEDDPLYQESFRLVEKKLLLHPMYLKNLFMLLKYGIKNKGGDMIEFGSYRCGTAIFLAKVAQGLGYTGKIYALDTFEGIPKTNEKVDFHLKGDFKSPDFKLLTDNICNLGLKNLVLVKGLFEETLPVLLPMMQKVVLAHIDCDVEASTRYAVLSIEKKMHAQGYMVVDDVSNPACLGVMQAVEETLCKRGFHAEQAWPHFVYRIPKLSANL